MKKVFGKFLIAFFVFTVVSGTFFPRESYAAFGIVEGDRVNVRAKPDLNAKVYTQLFKGDEVTWTFEQKKDSNGRKWVLVDILTVKGKPIDKPIRGWMDSKFVNFYE